MFPLIRGSADEQYIPQSLRRGIAGRIVPGHDAAGYATPQGLRNVLLISATPYQWKHIISQRVCRRNTDETRIVLLKVWKELYELSPALFAPSLTGPFCQMDRCLEGKMTCGRKLQADMTPEDILEKDYPALWEGGCR